MPTKHYIVRSVSWSDFTKKIILEDQSIEPHHKKSLVIPRSACVSKDDTVGISDEKAWVCCLNGGQADILPSYTAREKVKLGNLELDFLIKEITTEDEFSAYQSLTQFHYRGHLLHGRVVRLVIRNFHPVYPKIVGYIELATPFYMNKPRAQLLNASFQAGDVSWKAWDMSTMRQYIHSIVRIARCVIYPEFRGLGLGQLLIKHAMIFAQHRWQVAKMKPLFIEISADMLKFVPFAQKAGMVLIGQTEGNLDRVAKDIAYLLKNKSRIEDKTLLNNSSIGIVDKQISRMNQAFRLMEQQGWSISELFQRLDRLSHKSALRDFDLFHEIISLPKPTYMQGLVPEAAAFIHQRTHSNSTSMNVCFPPCHQLEPLEAPIVFQDVSVKYRGRVQRSYQTHAIQQAFGISPTNIEHTVLKELSFSIKPGEIILLTGPSGSGKTSLLKIFAEKSLEGVSGDVSWPTNYRPGQFSPIKSQKALIEVLARKNVEEALQIMGMVGLSDAFVYLKRYEELSNGQQYRAMLAGLITSACNLWLADEFCANLDSITANLVSKRLQAVARRLGATLVVASSQPENFVSALAPDHVLRLTSAWEYQYIPGTAFLRNFSNTSVKSNVPTLHLLSRYMPAVRSGQKRSTIRKGKKSVDEGLLLMEAGDNNTLVNVTNVRYTRFRCLTDQDATNDGFSDLDELQRALLQHYPDLNTNSWVTIVNFDLLQPAYSLSR